MEVIIPYLLCHLIIVDIYQLSHDLYQQELVSSGFSINNRTNSIVKINDDNMYLINARLENELSRLGLELPSIKTALEDGLSGQNLGAEQIADIISKLPIADGPRKIDSSDYNPEPKGKIQTII